MKKLFFVALLSSLAIGSAWADSDLMSLIGDIWGDDYAVISNSGSDKHNNASSYNLSTSDHNSFVVDYGDNGVIRGHGRCSTRNGTDPWSNGTYDVISTNFVDNLANETGQSGAQYCYCGLDSYTPVNGSAQSLSGPWVLFSNAGWDGAACAENCADGCADNLANGIPDSLAFRAAVFNAYAPSSSASGDAITTRTYVDNLLNTKQARITQTGTNKLMTFGNGTGATPGSRDIVSTLGTSTTATTVPETGPIVVGINSKQDAVNGTANYVMTGTGTVGTVGEKPVYSATTNYTNALVTAQTINTAATDAANGEMSCHTYVSGQSQTPANCLLWQIVQSAPTGLAIHIDLNTIIGADTSAIAYAATDSLGVNAWGNPQNYGIEGYSSAFAVDYGSNKGVVTGRGACSSASGTSNYNYSTVLDSLPDTSGGHCWCKLDGYTSPSGAQQSLSSRWVYLDNLGNNVISGSTQTQCENACALNCGDHLRYSSAYPVPFGLQIALFNAVQ